MGEYLGQAHILSYGSLVGMNLFNSSVVAQISFRALGRDQHGKLQSRLFPAYFAIQSALPLLIAVTYPGNKALDVPTGIRGVLHESNKKSTLLPLGAMVVTALLNLLWLQPSASSLRREKARLQAIPKEEAEKSGASAQLDEVWEKFISLHRGSVIINIINVVFSIGYGVNLGKRL